MNERKQPDRLDSTTDGSADRRLMTARWRHLDPEVLKRGEFEELKRRVEELERRLRLRP